LKYSIFEQSVGENATSLLADNKCKLEAPTRCMLQIILNMCFKI